MQIIESTADRLFNAIMLEFSKCEPMDGPVAYEIINANLVLTDPTHNTMCNCIRDMSLKYAIAEFLWYNSTVNDVAAIEPYSKFWRKLSDDGVTVNSNYGYCIRKKFGFDQWERCKQILRNNSDSRQAVIHIKEARDIIANPTKDLNCTIALQFFIRNNKLDLIVTMRSNDVWLGLPYDLFNFTCMQMQMAMELGIKVGTYYHNAGSLHMYTKDAEKLVKEVNAHE